jgi:hypothetical protein
VHAELQEDDILLYVMEVEKLINCVPHAMTIT